MPTVPQFCSIPNPCLILKKIQRNLKNRKRDGLQRLRETHVVKKDQFPKIVIPEILFDDEFLRERKNYYNIFDDDDY
jgi:hypothetical protein